MRLLKLEIQEPLPGQVLPEMSAAVGAEEAARRYRAVVLTTMRQLRGLQNARIRLSVSPDDADEAVRFWLLPKLADRWQMDGLVFRTEGWEVDFGGTDDGFAQHAHGDILCPGLGARWVHTALLGLGGSVSEVIGRTPDGREYFRAESVISGLGTRFLPEQPAIRHHDDWLAALDGPLGRALKKAWDGEA